MTTHRTGDQPEPKPGTIAHRNHQDAMRAQKELAHRNHQDAMRDQAKLDAEADPQDLSEDQAKSPVPPYFQRAQQLAHDRAQQLAQQHAHERAERAACELLANRSIALNNFAAPDVRVAAFKSMPKAEQRSMLAELGIERFDTHAWTSHVTEPLQPASSEDQATVPPGRVVLTSDKDRREAIDMVLNDAASDTTRIAAFRSLPMDTARLLLDELGVSNLKQYLNHQKSTQDHTEQHSMPHNNDNLLMRVHKARDGGLRNSVHQAEQPPEALGRRPLGTALDEYGDLLADLGSTIDQLEAKLRPVLTCEETPRACPNEDGDSAEAPAVAYARSHNACLARRIDWLSSIIERLEC